MLDPSHVVINLCLQHLPQRTANAPRFRLDHHTKRSLKSNLQTSQNSMYLNQILFYFVVTVNLSEITQPLSLKKKQKTKQKTKTQPNSFVIFVETELILARDCYLYCPRGTVD